MGDQVVAIRCRFKKTGKNFNFFKNFNQILENFSKKMKIFEIFLSPKIENFQIFLFGPKRIFNTPGSKLGHLEHFLGQKSQFKIFHFFNRKNLEISCTPEKSHPWHVFWGLPQKHVTF